MELKQAITQHLKNFSNLEDSYNSRKQQFYRNLLKLQLILLEIGVEIDKLKLAEFDESYNASNLPKASFTFENLNFQFILNSGSLQMWCNGQSETFLLPSENLGLGVNLQLAIADKILQNQKRAIA